MLKKRQNEDKEEKKVLHHNGKKLYEKPRLKEYGSIEKLTQTGQGSLADASHTSRR